MEGISASNEVVRDSLTTFPSFPSSDPEACCITVVASEELLVVDFMVGERAGESCVAILSGVYGSFSEGVEVECSCKYGQ